MDKTTQLIRLLAIFLLPGVLLPTTVSAQKEEQTKNEVSLSVQLRPRAEYRNGAYRPLQEGEAPAILINNRFRLNLDYNHSDLLKFHASLQNVNIWGQSNQVQISDPSGGMSVFEAYGDIKLGKTLRTKIGRQMIALDDDRLFGTLDWHPAGRSHDAVNFYTKNKKAEFQSWLAFNQNYKAGGLNINNPVGQFYSPTDAQPYQHMQLLYGKINITDKSYLSLLVNNLGFKTDDIKAGVVSSGKVHNMQTFGANWFGTRGKLKTQVSAFYQSGKAANGKSKSAYLLSGSAGYQVSQPINLTVGIDYLSGDSAKSTASTTRVFDPLYGTHHKFYGFMDYYYVGNGHSNVGLADAFLNLGYKYSAKTNWAVAAHWFNAAGKIVDGSKNKLSSNLGSEIDISFTHQLYPMVSVMGGYSTYFVSPSLKVVKNTPNARNWQDWLWLSVNINPKIFSARF